MTKVLALPAFRDNYIWLLLGANSSFICIDPGDADPVINFAQQHHLRLSHILLTHHHSDHIGGVDRLIKYFPDCIAYGPDDPRIPQSKPATPMTIGQLSFEILHTPGHTSSHISFFVPEHAWLFCGDTLFSSGCGRVFDGSMEELFNSLQLYKQLADNTLIYCAHEYTQKNLEFAHYVDPQNQIIKEQIELLARTKPKSTLPSTLAFEKEVNPFLRTDKIAIQQFALKHGAKSSHELDIFIALRLAKDVFNN